MVLFHQTRRDVSRLDLPYKSHDIRSVEHNPGQRQQHYVLTAFRIAQLHHSYPTQQNQAHLEEARVDASAEVDAAVASVEMEKCKRCVKALVANTLVGVLVHDLEAAASS
jgi:hypothetical protein